MKLRSMNAYVTEEPTLTIELSGGEVLELENALVLHSYSSRVAVYCKCEGCINWPCEGVCALTKHVETY